MSYAKWFLSIEKRNKVMEFTKVTIKKIQGGKKWYMKMNLGQKELRN